MEAISLVVCVCCNGHAQWNCGQHCMIGIETAVQKSCMHASAVAVFVEWWIVVFVDIISIHRGISTYGAIFLSVTPFLRRTLEGKF